MLILVIDSVSLKPHLKLPAMKQYFVRTYKSIFAALGCSASFLNSWGDHKADC